jgi:hypothetical protein
VRTGAPGLVWYRIEIGYRIPVDSVCVVEQQLHQLDGAGEVDLVDFIRRAHRGLDVGTGQAGVTTYDLPATESADHRVYLDGTEQLSGWSITPGAGENGRDQVAFVVAPEGQAITVDLVGHRVYVAFLALEDVILSYPAQAYADLEGVTLWSVG